MDHIIELESVDPPHIFTILRDGEWIGDIEKLRDGTWQGDITEGNGPPSRPYATRHEAVAYVVDPAGTRDAEAAKAYDPEVDYFAKCLTAGIPIERTDTGFKLG